MLLLKSLQKQKKKIGSIVDKLKNFENLNTVKKEEEEKPKEENKESNAIDNIKNLNEQPIKDEKENKLESN